MIPRAIASELKTQLSEYPVVTVLGPRQAGKTTLVRSELPDYDYVTLEDPEARLLASEDPKAFLARYPKNTILDEIQRSPILLSYIQGIVDEQNQNGRFVLTGSHQLELRAAITQSLAGRTGILHLLPLSIDELGAVNICFDTFEDYLFQGFMPRVYDQQQRPRTAYGNYYQTYVERDVRQLIKLKDVTLFEKFLKLMAGRTGQLINYQSLANDIGISSHTVKEWLSILEASFILFKLPPYFENFGKRAIKSPKYYFVEPGLLTYLLDIENPGQVSRDPLVGNLFENLVVLEYLKARYNRGQNASLYFFRDSHGNEVDLLFKMGRHLAGVEIKSASTWTNEFTRGLKRFSESNAPLQKAVVVYNGNNITLSNGIHAVHFREAAHLA